MERSARTVLDALVRSGNRTIEETCALFNSTAVQMGERGVTLSVRQLSRWLAGEVGGARPAMRRVAEQLWRLPFEVLTRPPAPGQPPAIDGDAIGGSAPAWVLENLADAEARASVGHAATVGIVIEPISIEQLAADVRLLARRYCDTPSLVSLRLAAAARDRAYELHDRTRQPGQQADLLVLAGQACGLIAHACVDMALWPAAASQVRAARTYADMTGHDGLKTWAVGTDALIKYWSGHPAAAADVASAGIAHARHGAPAARLRAIQARALALAGAAFEAHEAIAAGDRELEAADGDDELFNVVGGEFGWGESLHNACAGTALIAARDYPAAADRLAMALAAADSDPWAQLVPERVHADIALAEVAGGRLDSAAAALDHVWPMPAAQRRVAVVGRLDAVAQALNTGRWRTDPAASELRERVLAFTAEASSQWELTAS